MFKRLCQHFEREHEREPRRLVVTEFAELAAATKPAVKTAIAFALVEPRPEFGDRALKRVTFPAFCRDANVGVRCVRAAHIDRQRFTVSALRSVVRSYKQTEMDVGQPERGRVVVVSVARCMHSRVYVSEPGRQVCRPCSREAIAAEAAAKIGLLGLGECARLFSVGGG